MLKTNMMKNFTLEELCRSKTAVKHGIANNPSTEYQQNLIELTKHILEPAREALGIPITVNSGYRSPKLNTIVGGAANSQHLRGEAADITCADNRKLFTLIRNNYQYDQLINENNYTWIHVSFRLGNNRRQAFNLDDDK